MEETRPRPLGSFGGSAFLSGARCRCRGGQEALLEGPSTCRHPGPPPVLRGIRLQPGQWALELGGARAGSQRTLLEPSQQPWK